MGNQLLGDQQEPILISYLTMQAVARKIYLALWKIEMCGRTLSGEFETISRPDDDEEKLLQKDV